jgi:hypothetical protein
MIKLCQVTKVEVGSPGDFAKLGNREIALEQKAGPEARKLFEKFVHDVQKLQAQQDQETGKKVAHPAKGCSPPHKMTPYFFEAISNTWCLGKARGCSSCSLFHY